MSSYVCVHVYVCIYGRKDVQDYGCVCMYLFIGCAFMEGGMCEIIQ